MHYFGADGKALMPLRLALLVAAALIFAPHQPGGETSSSAEGADLTARVLAPTFDEGATRSATQEFSYLFTTRHATRLSTDPKPGHPISVLVAGIALSVLWLLRPNQNRALHRIHCSPRLSRGPPLLQLA